MLLTVEKCFFFHGAGFGIYGRHKILCELGRHHAASKRGYVPAEGGRPVPLVPSRGRYAVPRRQLQQLRRHGQLAGRGPHPWVGVVSLCEGRVPLPAGLCCCGYILRFTTGCVVRGSAPLWFLVVHPWCSL